MHARSFSSRKNFFKFRLSPIVSGAVYVSYMVFLISVIDREVSRWHLCLDCAGADSGRRRCWAAIRHTQLQLATAGAECRHQHRLLQ
jgi:hypothetical protein